MNVSGIKFLNKRSLNVLCTNTYTNSQIQHGACCQEYDTVQQTRQGSLV